MKKNNSSKRGPQDTSQPASQPEKIGWIRKFCGKGIFREIWKNRFVVLKGDQLYISEKEVKDEKKIQEVFDLTDYEKSEELRKSRSRSKKNHSKFTLLRSREPGNTVPNLVFLAVSPEEKESWINAMNGAITRAKNRILDEVTVEEDSFLAHPTRDRAKIQHTRRPPTRGHLMAVASTSTSDGMLTLDLIQEEESPCERAVPQREGGRSESLPRRSEITWEREQQDDPRPYTPQAGKKLCPSEKNKCASLDEILSRSEHGPPAGPPLSQLQELIAHKLERTQALLAQVTLQEQGRKGKAAKDSEAERLLQEAVCTWGQAREVLGEVQELRALYQQMGPAHSLSPRLKSPEQTTNRKSLM